MDQAFSLPRGQAQAERQRLAELAAAIGSKDVVGQVPLAGGLPF